MISRSPLRRAVLAALSLFILLPALAGAYQADRVVLVIIDGLRYSEGLGDPASQYTPRMAALAAEGAIVGDFRNDGITYTNRAIPAIWCGAWTDIHSFEDPDCNGYDNNYTELPSVFEYYRKHLDRSAADCVYVLKNLCPWRASFDPAYGPDYWPLYHAEGYSDTEVFQETVQVIADQSPRFLLMYLADVDHAGHGGVWNDYIQAITTADHYVGELWDTLQADPAYAGRTTMLVTNDHGRHDWDFSGHGDGCDGCRHIQLLAVGPDVQPGLVSEVPRVIPDIAPTIGELLGFATEYATGTAMVELFDTGVGVESVPVATAAVSAYPNPFNPATTVTFTLPADSPVDLRIYDQTGREVRRLLREFRPAGPARVAWDGTDGRGRGLPSGTYLVRLKTATDASAAKVVLLK